ncbi:DUF5719 family protein [Pseudolysinimonas sp.]|uniref:DUF5719 family protein n=1 Tax=Pseudolysinimonas sp. TaxID=2680009 RepID=UPI00286A8EAE|nr:DUF5719 family protein [Pseudolysinimonas sp.]
MAEPKGLLIGARIASGTMAAGAAAVVIAAVAFLPLPTFGPEARTVTVEPAPADQVRVCPGSVIRVGDETGGSTDSVFAIGAPTISGEARGGELERTRLLSADSTGSAASTPEALRAPPSDGALVAGAQSQDVDAPDFRGLAATSCAEPSGSIWLVGGATTVGRSTLLLLANPTDVPSRVTLEIFGEEGQIAAPGMSGIDVPANGQRVLSLAGFAPGVASPVVHVTARGGRVVATLQQSIVRGLDSVGVETVGGGADPGESLVVPGVRIFDTVGTNRASALADWHDIGPAIRLAVTGATAGRATVRVVPETPGAVGTSFEVELEPGLVTEVPLDSGTPEGGATEDGTTDGGTTDGAGEGDAHGFEDGVYTVYVDAEMPVVAAVRASTAVDSGVDPAPDAILDAPDSDLAWFAAAPPLAGEALVVVPEGPSPLISIVNPLGLDVEIELSPLSAGAEPTLVAIPAGGALSMAVDPGAYLLSGVQDLSIAVTFAAPGALAAFVVSPARPVAGSLVVHPD